MTKMEMAVNAALYHLKQGPMTCSQLGSMLWGRPSRKPSAFARPAGKLLHHMKRAGLVTQYFDGKHFFLWKLTQAALKLCKPSKDDTWEETNLKAYP